ncbi:esterase [Enterobacter sp. ENT03]|uniref:esterase n=1 Tax=Enterobacter sp. ENT03 TaxID=2854780 RepID=UPI001C4404A2|nr:esterase [Enterobacter sp. ENT03]MBV7406008.1 esterase [Enterobacter sp. ENT03]
MIELETRHLAGIEILHATPAGQREQPLPTVVFYHGFSSSKLVYSYFAVALAQAGMRVVMPDARDHGARFNGDAIARLGQFWQILHSNLLEFAALQKALYDEGLIKDARLAVGGASMGGMTALGIMTQHPEVKCVASLMGSGYFTTLARTLFPPDDLQQAIAPLADRDVSRHLPRLADRPLLLWHGEEDDVVPAEESWRLQQALTQAGLDQQLTCVWEAGVKHRITPVALAATVDFFRAHL